MSHAESLHTGHVEPFLPNSHTHTHIFSIFQFGGKTVVQIRTKKVKVATIMLLLFIHAPPEIVLSLESKGNPHTTIKELVIRNRPINQTGQYSG